jgi:hypothetical protein
MIDADPADSFDLPEDCTHDHVVIYPTDAPKDPPFYAVPFDLREVHDDGTEWYDEPDMFTVTDQYREAVADLASMDIEDVKLRRDELPTGKI